MVKHGKNLKKTRFGYIFEVEKSGKKYTLNIAKNKPFGTWEAEEYSGRSGDYTTTKYHGSKSFSTLGEALEYAKKQAKKYTTKHKQPKRTRKKTKKRKGRKRR